LQDLGDDAGVEDNHGNMGSGRETRAAWIASSIS
jgi:hypothetical protein